MPIYQTINRQRHVIYANDKEFFEHNPDSIIVENWRDGTEGDWIKGDDGSIMQVLKRKVIYSKSDGRPNTYIRTPTGTFLSLPTTVLDGVPRKNIYSFGGDPSKERKTATRRERLFALYISLGVSPADAYLRSFRTDNPEYATQRAFIILRSDRVKEAIWDETRKAAERTGLTPEEVLIGVRKIAQADTGKNKEDAKTRLKAWDQLADYIGMKNKEQAQAGQLPQGGEFAGFLVGSAQALIGNEEKLLDAETATAEITPVE